MKLFYQVEPGSPRERKVIKSAISLAGFSVLLDQITKVFVVEMMKHIGTRVPVIDGFFDLTYITNKGAAWGMFHGYGMVLFAIGMAVTVGALCFLRKLCDGFRERYIAILVVISGVIGNSIDRIWRGEVVDFLDCYIKNHHWPAFNIADCAICIGIFIYLFSVLLRPAPESTSPASENAR